MLTPLTVFLVMSQALVSDFRWTKELRQKKLIKNTFWQSLFPACRGTSQNFPPLIYFAYSDFQGSQEVKSYMGGCKQRASPNIPTCKAAPVESGV